MSSLLDVATPRWVPEGYRLASTTAGARADGFPGAGDGVALSYSLRGKHHAMFPLLVYAAAGDAGPLFGTERRAGTAIAIDAGEDSAVYHDGMWTPQARSVDRSGRMSNYRWDTHDVHSITMKVNGVTIAVRGARSRGIDLSTLKAVARSLVTNGGSVS